MVKSSLNPECESFVPDDELVQFRDILDENKKCLQTTSEKDFVEDEIYSDGSGKLVEDLFEVNNDGFIYDELEDLTVDSDVCLDNLDCFMSRMCAAELLIIPVSIDDISLRALVDTGASDSLMQENVSFKLRIDPDKDKCINIKGLGNKIILSEGTVHTDINLLNKTIANAKFNVIRNKDSRYDILGEKFLRENKFIINVKSRQISVTNLDGSKSSFYIRKDGNLRMTMHEKVPVYASENVTLFQ